MKAVSKLLALLLAIAMTFSLASCGSKSAEQDSASKSETASEGEASTGGVSSISIGSTCDEWIDSLDPDGYGAASISYGYAYLVYDILVYWDPISDELTSDILSDWHFDENDDTTLYMTLKDGIYFSNGDQMTGEDVLFSMQILSQSFNFGEYYQYIDFENSYVEDDGLTIVVKYTQTFGPGIKGMQACWIQNKSWIEEHGGLDAFDYYDMSLVCGSGPYALTDFVKDTSMKLEYRTDWWMADDTGNESCQAQEVNLLNYTDATTMMIDYENSVIDIALYGLTDSDISRFDSGETHGAYKIIDTNSNVLIVLDPDQENISDVRVREAICHAIDCDAIAESVYGVLSGPADDQLASTVNGYVGGHRYEYDPELSKSLLAEAGVSDLSLTMVVASSEDEIQIGEMVQGYLDAVGISMELNVLDMDSAVGCWMDPSTSGELQQFKSAGGNLLHDPLFVTSAFLPTSIFSILSRDSGDVLDAIQRGLSTTDEAERTAAYQELENAFYADAEIIPLCAWYTAVCYNTDTISDISLSGTYDVNLRFITLAD